MFGWNIEQAILYPIIIVVFLFYFHYKVFGENYYVEFTNREKIVSVGIGAIIITIIVVLFNSLSAKEGEYSRILTSATYIDNKDTFDYASKTSIGNSIISTTFSTNEPISDRIAENCLYLKRDYEEYRQHTYTTTDSKGNTTVHTYWSWDLINTDIFKSNSIKIFDNIFNMSTLNIEFRNLEDIGIDEFAYHKRYIYRGIYNNSQGILLTFLENNNIIDNDVLIEKHTIFYNKLDSKEAIINQIQNEVNQGKIVVIIFFIILGIGIILFFAYAENDWLNNEGRRPRW